MEEFSSSKQLQRQDGPMITPRLALAIFASVLGMLSFGYSVGVINAPEAVIRQFYNETWISRYDKPIGSDTVTLIWAFSVSITAVGGMIGGVSAGWWADRFGRRGSMLIHSSSGILAGVLMGFSKMAGSFEMLIVGRLLVGLHCGLMTGMSPMYTAEVSPDQVRGALGTVNQLATTVGILLSQALGLAPVMGNDKLWPILLGLAMVPPLLQLALLPLCPESPRYLYLTVNRAQDAVKSLMILRGKSNSDDVKEELDQMKQEQGSEESEQKMSICQVLTSRALRMPLIISVVMQLSQQLTGINIIFYYSTGLFINIGLEDQTAQYATLAVGAIMVSMTLVSIPLMDRAGRRTLHLTGLGGMFIFSIFFTIFYSLTDKGEWLTYASVISALVFVVFFALGPGSIPWMIVAELFTTGVRPAAISISVIVNWAANFVVGQSFPPLQKAMQSLVFLPFTGVLAITFAFLFKFLPETKNKTVEEIAAMFNRGWGNKKSPFGEVDGPKESKVQSTQGLTSAATGIANVAQGITNKSLSGTDNEEESAKPATNESAKSATNESAKSDELSDTKTENSSTISHSTHL